MIWQWLQYVRCSTRSGVFLYYVFQALAVLPVWMCIYLVKVNHSIITMSKTERIMQSLREGNSQSVLAFAATDGTGPSYELPSQELLFYGITGCIAYIAILLFMLWGTKKWMLHLAGGLVWFSLVSITLHYVGIVLL